jgi:hypothetical protein
MRDPDSKSQRSSIQGKRWLDGTNLGNEDQMSLLLFFFFFRFILFIVCKYTVAVFRYQKRASGLVTDGCEPPCGCWDLNSGPPEEQSVLLTTEQSLQPSFF